jgi:hypothetical protein
MATENSISTGWILFYVVLTLVVLYGALSFVGAF